MLFNSYVFIFGFLPLTLAVFYVAAAVRAEYARWWLAAASLYFYGYWNVSFLPLLIGSIAFNYSAGRIIASLRLARPTWCTPALIAAVSLNLCLLGFFKYATFAQNTFWQLTG